MNFELCAFTASDATEVNRVALSAFQQYRNAYDEWEGFSERIANMAALTASADLVVAKVGGRIRGAVAYAGPGRKKGPFFAPGWAAVRMLVVDPAFRGIGLGRALMQECLGRAVRDRAPLIALHTSPIMTVALSMYERMGFRLEREVPPINGVPYGIYVLGTDHLAGAVPAGTCG